MTEYFVVKNVANIMKASDPDSALLSQAIAGTIVTVEKAENDYCYVKTPDLYQGWIAKSRLTELWDRSAYETICIKTLFAQAFVKPDENSALLTKLVIGTRLAQTNKEIAPFIEILLPDKQKAYVHKSCVSLWSKSLTNESIFAEKWLASKTSEREQIIAKLGRQVVYTAKRFMGTPYLWGGTTPFGMDCSGLTQLVYKSSGVQLLRDSYMQWEDKRFYKIDTGKALDEAKLQAGDILVFDIKQKGKVDHIGIACGDGTFIQTRGEMKDGGVVIDRCADTYYKQIYIGVARLSPEANINITASL